MKTIISEQQGSFFTANGHIEYELPHEPFSCSEMRDQFRKDETLKDFIFRKLAPLALALSGKKQLRLGLSYWITEKNRPAKALPLKKMFNIQSPFLGMSIATSPQIPLKRSALGILPLPSEEGRVLIFRSEILLDFPHVTSDFLLIAFTLPNAVYIYNPMDPEPLFLKKLGYQIGDRLKNETHPLIF